MRSNFIYFVKNRIIMKYLFIVLLIIFSGCTSEYTVKKEIEKANYCEVKSDCVLIESKCPFDCYVGVNKDREDRIRNLIDNHNSKCVYSCVEVKGVDCINNKCEVVR